MTDVPIRVIFVCTGNSARSQMAEAILREQGEGTWGLDDPVDVEGTEAQRQAAFDRVVTEVGRRINAFIPIALSRAPV